MFAVSEKNQGMLNLAYVGETTGLSIGKKIVIL